MGSDFPEHFKLERATSLGLQLVSVLARQLRGDLRVETTAGARVTMVFPQTERERPVQ